MYQTVEIEQLEKLSLAEVKNHKAKALARKAELEAFKTSTEKGKFTPSMQEELDNLALYLVDVEDIIEVKAKEAPAKYVVAPGSENCVHLSLLRGRKFNPETGEPEQPYVQLFSYGEWQLFKKHFAGLGYSIMKVLHDPYNEAAQYVYKKPIKK